MKINTKTLINGIRVLSVHMPDSLSQTTMVLVGVGSDFESNEDAGISHFLEHMCFKGTKRRPTSLDVARSLDAIGAKSNAFTDHQMTGFYAKTSNEFFKESLDVLADVYLNSTLPKTELEKEKGVIIDEIRMYQDDPQSRVSLLFDALIFPNLPAGRPIIGSKETVSATTREKMEKYRNRYYNASNTVVVVSGGIPAEEAFEETENKFSSVSMGEKTEIPALVPAIGEKFILDTDKTEQAHLIIGSRSFGIEDPDRYAGLLLATILGGNMSSRLFQKIREELGLGYYVYAHQSLAEKYGSFSVAVGVDPKRALEVVNAIVEEFKKIRETPVSDHELILAKNYIGSQVAFSKENNEQVAMWFGMEHLFGHPLETHEEKIKKISAVAIEDIYRVAKRVLDPKYLQLAIIGPTLDATELKKALS